MEDLWQYLQATEKTVVMYGMGNGADKILEVCAEKGIEIADFFASDGFVRGHLFHGKRVLSYSETCERYGKENMIVLLSFASSLPDVLANIYRIAEECELYAPDVPVSGEQLFDGAFYEHNRDKLDLVESLLADERSKEVYRSVIDYKLSGDVRLLKETFSDFSEVYRLLGAARFERVADLGAYNGDTLRELAPFAPHLKEAVAFEPDRRNYRKLCEYVEGEDRFAVNAVNSAAWSHAELLQFDGSGNRNATLLSGDNVAVNKPQKLVEVQAESLDHILDGKKVDYIKFDVEGAEREAFAGACQTIESCRPALYMSLYHRSEDIFALPLMIHERFPDYQFYIRRREYVPAWDTVLIAVPC